ncbi:MAG: hypothetical protein ACFFD8_04790 [Candidatus Thorarchaeota archaeon]
MELTDAARNLLKFGSLLGLVLGLISTLFWLSTILVRMGLFLASINIYDVLMVVFSLVAIFLCYFILTHFSKRIDDDPSRAALYLIVMGLVIALGAWGIAGLLVVIGASLILVEETR